MDRLNSAFYTDSYLPGTDGVVTSIVNFKKGLEKKGHRVYIFASSNMQGARRIREKNVFFYQGIEFKPYPQYSVALFPYNSMLKVKGLGIDIVHSQTPFMMGFAGLISAKMLRLPLVGSFHTMIIGNKPIRDYYLRSAEPLLVYALPYIIDLLLLGALVQLWHSSCLLCIHNRCILCTIQ